jgi:hypothetical protein
MLLNLNPPEKRAPNPSLSLTARSGGFPSRWSLIFTALLATIAPALAGIIKIGALAGWRYTSDLFLADLLLQESLRGHLGLDFCYGSQFGDHAYLLLLVLVPVKYVLGGKMIFLLVLLPPLTLLICGVVVYRCAAAIGGTQWGAFATAIYLLSPGVLRGTSGGVSGFTIDMLCGYVAVAVAFLLLRHNECRRGAVMTIISIAVFVLMKEEMAVLGTAFFLILLLLPESGGSSTGIDRPRTGGLEPRRLQLIGLSICVTAFAAEWMIIHAYRTQWNRSNAQLLRFLESELRQDGLFGFLRAFSNAEYWTMIGMMLAILIALAVVGRRLNRFAVALAGMGLIKFAFAWAVPDFKLWTWHNYPALVMLGGAISIQAIELRHMSPARFSAPKRLAIVVPILLGCGWFASTELPFFLRQLRANQSASVRVKRLRPALEEVLRRVDKSKVASIPTYAAYAFSRSGCRYSFFPRGITAGPAGIADMIVLRVVPHAPSPPEASAFTLIYHNGHYALYRRTGFLAGEEESRQEFINQFGRNSIGAPARARAAAHNNKKLKLQHSPPRE